MGKNSGFLFGAIVGGVVGAATAIFLTSEKGKQWLEELNKNETLEPLKETANEWLEIAKEKTKEVAKFVPIAKTGQEAPQEEITTISIPLDNKPNIEKLLKETEAALHEAEQKLHEE